MMLNWISVNVDLYRLHLNKSHSFKKRSTLFWQVDCYHGMCCLLPIVWVHHRELTILVQAKKSYRLFESIDNNAAFNGENLILIDNIFILSYRYRDGQMHWNSRMFSIWLAGSKWNWLCVLIKFCWIMCNLNHFSLLTSLWIDLNSFVCSIELSLQIKEKIISGTSQTK